MIALFVLSIVTVMAADPYNCPETKNVGGVCYVRKEFTDARQYGCQSDCSYTTDDGGIYCFKAGNLPVRNCTPEEVPEDGGETTMGPTGDPEGCCPALAVGGDLDPYGSVKGVYHKSLMTHNNKPYYKARALDMCIFFTDWWKVDQCKYVEPAHKNDKSVGYLSSFIHVTCPAEIGLQWRLYSGGVNGYPGPIQPNATVSCVYD